MSCGEPLPRDAIATEIALVDANRANAQLLKDCQNLEKKISDAENENLASHNWQSALQQVVETDILMRGCPACSMPGEISEGCDAVVCNNNSNIDGRSCDCRYCIYCLEQFPSDQELHTHIAHRCKFSPNSVANGTELNERTFYAKSDQQRSSAIHRHNAFRLASIMNTDERFQHIKTKCLWKMLEDVATKEGELARQAMQRDSSLPFDTPFSDILKWVSIRGDRFCIRNGYNIKIDDIVCYCPDEADVKDPLDLHGDRPAVDSETASN